MEAKDYAFGAFDLSASGFGAPHIRQRLWFVADTDNAGSQGWIPRGPDQEREDQHGHAGRNGATHIGVGNTDLHDGRHGDRALTSDGQARVEHGSASATIGLADTASSGRQHEPSIQPTGVQSEEAGNEACGSELSGHSASSDGPDKTNGHWRDADWIFCRDGKWRPVEPNTCPLADGAPSRVGRLRAYGNGIVPQVAQGLIESYMETRKET
jgi:DNA (cytosine-5)-methyltransferase 1